MSTRERAKKIFDSLTEEQLEDFIVFFQNPTDFEPSNIEYSDKEIEAMLEEAEEAVRNGDVYTEEEMNDFFKENFGI